MTTEEIKLYLYNHKVCVVTNSISLPSSLLLPSLKTYIDYLPLHNFWIIPGFMNGVNFYGVNAFVYMLQYMLQNNNFDYAIYIDEDCFINDFSALIEEFEIFRNSNKCLAGIQDGGSLCHRNHSKYCVNTFLSFWNIKMYREKGIKPGELTDFVSEGLNHLESTHYEFLDRMSKNSPDLLKTIEKIANSVINLSKKHRKTHVKSSSFESEYATTVRNDKDNEIEQNQEPYTSDDYDSKVSFEPYYLIEYYLIEKTETPVYYLFGTDFYDEEYKGKCDTSGLTTAVRTYSQPHTLIAVHTWFSRMYTKWPVTEQQMIHTKRINTIINTFSHI